MTLEPKRLRIGDAERNQAGQVLAEAYTAGRLTHVEYSERAGQSVKATFGDELEALVADLVPGQPSGALAVPASVAFDRTLAPTSRPSAGSPVSLAFMSGTVRAGDWTVASNHAVVAFWGGVDIDLREARFTSKEVSIVAVAIMGGVRVFVPPDVRVRIQGLPIMGGFSSNGRSINPESVPADAPVVTVTGLALMGGVSVERLDYGDVYR